MKECGVRPLAVYGLTEVGPFICVNENEVDIPEGMTSVLGEFHDGYKGKIVGEKIFVNGEGINYNLDLKSSTIERLSENFYETGDYGFQSGALFFYKGRGRDEINLGGFKFSLSEVRQELLRIDQIQDALVYSQSHDIYGEVPVAEVTLNENIEVSAIKSLLKQRLNSLKVPRKIHFVDSFDKTSIDKSFKKEK